MRTPVYSDEVEQHLMVDLWSASLSDNPEAFVRYVFPWGQKDTPLARFTGPRKWQREVLAIITKNIAKNKEAGMTADEAKEEAVYGVIRLAVASGRGIGKSALVAWLVLWMLSTRIGGSVVVSANSENQLRSVTWAELTKWTAMSINSHWWEVSATKLVPAQWLTELVERDMKKGTRYWSAEGKLWSAENPDGYAGPHNHDGMMLIFDESSGIPNPIWEVGAGFFTENTPNRYWFAFSNPRRNEGYFFECFNAKRDYWETKNIDARTVEDTDKAIYSQIIDEFGADSLQAKVEVYGEFPGEGEDQFISPALVDDAMTRPRYKDLTAPIIIGVDPARGGLDSTVILVRQGRDVIAVKKYHGGDTMETVGRVIEAIEEYKPVLTVIDEGGLGYGVLDRLTEQRYKVKGINFGNKSKNPIMWGNKRAEMWGAMREWLRTGSIPNDRKMRSDLISPQTKPNSAGTIFLEGKKEMKARGLASPDSADALAVTFAFPVAHRETYESKINLANGGNRPYNASSPATGWMGH
jgi:hypothetical protein